MSEQYSGPWRVPEMQGGNIPLYEGRRVFARGQSMWATILIVTLGLGSPIVPLLWVDPQALPLVFSLFVGPWVVVVAMLLLAGRGRIRITNDEVQIRRWLGTRVIPRAAIATVLHAHKRTGGLRRTGYVALIDHDDQLLWGSASHIWPAETIEALQHTGRQVNFGTLPRKRARQQFPDVFKVRIGRLLARLVIGLLVLALAFAVLIVVIAYITF